MNMKGGVKMEKEKADTDLHFFNPVNTTTESNRIICTPSFFAKSTLFYIQEIGRLKSLRPHKSSREALSSYLYFAVLKGKGILTYSGKPYNLSAGDHVFIDCRHSYTHESSEADPWELCWIHFNGNNMERYYMCFHARESSTVKNPGPVIRPADTQSYQLMHEQLMGMAEKVDTSTELQISYLLHGIVTRLIVDADKDTVSNSSDKMNALKSYIDENFNAKLSLDFLAKHFYISKYHMCKEFKQHYGITINNYINTRRVARSMELLRYSDMPIREISQHVGIEDANYFNKVFQKLAGITASEYKKNWKGRA